MQPAATVSSVANTTAVTVGATGGEITNRAALAAATRPGLLPSAHCMPAAKHQTATTARNTPSYDADIAPRKTAAPSCSDTTMTSGTRPAGLSCIAIAPAIAAAPEAHTAADGDADASATAAIARTPSRLRDTAPMSGVVCRRAQVHARPAGAITPLPVAIQPFSPHRGRGSGEYTPQIASRI